MNIKKAQNAPAKAEMLDGAVAAAAFLKVLSHPQRLCMLCHMLDKERSVNELAELCDIPQPQVSQFLSRMRLEKLVAFRREGRSTLYFIADARLQKVLQALFEVLCSHKNVL